MSDSQFEREMSSAHDESGLPKIKIEGDFVVSYKDWRISVNNQMEAINKRVKFIKWQIQAISFAWLMTTAAFGMCAYMMWIKW